MVWQVQLVFYLVFLPFAVNLIAAIVPAAIAKPAATPTIISSAFELEVVVVFGVPTAIGVPVRADAGMVHDTVCGAVNLVAAETQVFPFQ